LLYFPNSMCLVCFRNVHKRFMNFRAKEGRNSFVAQVLIGACHKQTCTNKKSVKVIMTYEPAGGHKKRTEISGEKRLFGLFTRPVR
jgi:hypothetical protein